MEVLVEEKKKKSPAPDKQRRAKSKVSPKVSTVDLETTMSLKYIVFLSLSLSQLQSGTDAFNAHA